jgi:hypothetical protein
MQRPPPHASALDAAAEAGRGGLRLGEGGRAAAQAAAPGVGKVDWVFTVTMGVYHLGRIRTLRRVGGA